MSDGGKGSAPRPFSVAHDEWSRRWDAIFGRDLQEGPRLCPRCAQPLGQGEHTCTPKETQQ